MHDQPNCQQTAKDGRTADLIPFSAGDRSAIVNGPVDAMLLAGEWAFRQVYWRSELLRRVIQRSRHQKRPSAQSADRTELTDYLRTIGVAQGSLVMAHTSVTGMSLTSKDGQHSSAENPLQVAQELISTLIDLVGETGTLAMSTQPAYKKSAREPGSEEGVSIPVYDPVATPCGIGLANEIFRRKTGTRRSLFPQNPLAARGPLADELLKENLTDSKPLPHGVQSGYYRFCERNGLVVSIGVPLFSCFTVSHVAEEIRDAQWPVANFFQEEKFILRHNGEDQTVTIRKTRPEFMMFGLCGRKYRRDLVQSGVLHEGLVGSVRVDWARAGDVLRFLLERNQTSAYPFFGTSFVPRKDLGHAA